MERETLPNSTTALVLGILSILTCLCYGIVGLPLGIIAIVLGNKALKEYYEYPDNFKGAGNANAGKILGIVGVILNLLYLGFIAWAIYTIGWDAMQDPELMQQRINEILGK